MPAIPVRVRLAGIALLAILLVHLSAVHIVPESTYAQKTALSKWTSSGGFRDDRATVEQIYRDGEDKAALTNATHAPRANAAFVILARNTDLWSIMESIRSMEDRFNRKYKCGQRDSACRGGIDAEDCADCRLPRSYPYVFLNDKPFDERFIKMTSGITSGKTSYGLVPAEHWGKHPSWIDEDKAKLAREDMAKNNVIYGDSVPYREMCRYQSGFFFRHELLKDYDWYWRIEPDVKFFCDLDYDPFLYMQENKKEYGFTWVLGSYSLFLGFVRARAELPIFRLTVDPCAGSPSTSMPRRFQRSGRRQRTSSRSIRTTSQKRMQWPSSLKTGARRTTAATSGQTLRLQTSSCGEVKHTRTTSTIVGLCRLSSCRAAS